MGRIVAHVVAGAGFFWSLGTAQAAEANTLEHILVSGRPYGQNRLDSLQSGTVLADEDLAHRIQGSLGETLSGLPGISASFFGPVASRPIIRGLGGDRVRILSGGIGSIDASSTSPDHAVALDTLTAERIEIIRGPGTLLYGGAAIGGVVNIIDGRIPGALPENGLSGGARVFYGSNADERSLDAAATVALGNVAVHVDGSSRKTDDYKIPGFAEREAHDADEAYGHVPQSWSKQNNAAVGASYIFDAGYLGFSYSRTDMTYGVPGHGVHDDDHDDDHDHDHDHDDDHAFGTSIDMTQDRFDMMGELTAPFLIFEKTKIRFGYADYEHRELEGDEIGTIFKNKGYEGRIELVQEPMGRLRGAVGAQIFARDFAAIGAEAFTPATETQNLALFAVEELDFNPLTFEFGARYEHQAVDAEDIGRNFDSLSLSAGLRVDLADDWVAGITLSRSERAPNAEELYSDGPHVATRAYEIGNTDLSKERALSVEAMVRKTAGRLSGALSLYHTRFANFIYQDTSGDLRDDLTLYDYRQADAIFEGGELELSYKAIDDQNFSLRFEASADLVRAHLRNGGGPLPRIPSERLTLGAIAEGGSFDLHLEMQFVGAQNRVAAYETMTDGYRLLHVSLNIHPFENRDLTLSLQGRNLANVDARSSTSFLKDEVPLPGRDIRAGISYKF